MAPQQPNLDNLSLEAKAKLRRDYEQAGLKEFAREFGLLPKKAEALLANFITEDVEMKEMKKVVLHLSDLEEPVYIHGESGTGKELIALALHGDRSDFNKEKNGKFVPVNCAAISPELFESELFGHMEGSFTGASKSRVGLMEHAHPGGTLFLDEIAEMPLPLQAKLLRAIQEKQIRRVGDNTVRPVSCRIVVATHRNLFQMTQSGLFREDLYWRLCAHKIYITPLRNRPGDIRELLDAKFDKNHELTEEERESLVQAQLTGNVRELDFRVRQLFIKKKLSLTLYKL